MFVTQLEQPAASAQRGLEIARAAGVVTVFNPAPAEPIPDAIYPLCDYIVPNETEAATLTGLSVATLNDAKRVGDALLAKGAKNALITLGERDAGRMAEAVDGRVVDLQDSDVLAPLVPGGHRLPFASSVMSSLVALPPWSPCRQTSSHS